MDYPLTESCEALNGVRGTIVDVEWKVFDPKSDRQWIRFGYCNEHMNCKVSKNLKRLPNGIKVLNITENGTLRILQGSVNNNRNIQSRLQCQVQYVDGNSAVKSHEVKINFTACTCKFSSLNLRTGERGGGVGCDLDIPFATALCLLPNFNICFPASFLWLLVQTALHIQ